MRFSSGSLCVKGSFTFLDRRRNALSIDVHGDPPSPSCFAALYGRGALDRQYREVGISTVPFAFCGPCSSFSRAQGFDPMEIVSSLTLAAGNLTGGLADGFIRPNRTLNGRQLTLFV